MIIKLLYFYLIYENKTIMENLTLNTFKEKIMDYEKNPDNWVFEGKIPAIIDFYASWCGPCKMMSPIIDELSQDFEGKVKIGKVNTDNNRKLTEKYNIMSIPAMYIFKNGEVADQIIGAVPKSVLEEKLNLAL